MKPDKQKQRKEAEFEAREDLNKSVKQLLADIHDESVNTSKDSEANAAAICRTTARFASLLSVLSIKAEKQLKENIELQNRTMGPRRGRP